MKKLVLMVALAVVLAPAIAAAADGKPAQTGARYINNQAPASCSLCFSCGGDWPVLNGKIPNQDGQVTERGSACANPLTARTDTIPYLCCN